MNRSRMLALLALLTATLGAGARSLAEEAGCCGHCGCQRVCQVMCEMKYVKVLRYKAEATVCPPPCDCCCDDRWILGCCKPIRVIGLRPYEEVRKIPVRKYVVYRCPQCDAAPAAPADAPPKP